MYIYLLSFRNRLNEEISFLTSGNSKTECVDKAYKTMRNNFPTISYYCIRVCHITPQNFSNYLGEVIKL